MPAFAQQAFPTPDAAGDALVKALGTTNADTTQLAALLGKDWRNYIPTGSVDRSDVDAFLTKYRTRHAWRDTGTDRKMLAVGAES